MCFSVTEGNGKNIGAIVGGIVGGIVFLVVVALALYYLSRRFRVGDGKKEQQQALSSELPLTGSSSLGQ